jgi:hypothetical protein
LLSVSYEFDSANVRSVEVKAREPIALERQEITKIMGGTIQDFPASDTALLDSTTETTTRVLLSRASELINSGIIEDVEVIPSELTYSRKMQESIISWSFRSHLILKMEVNRLTSRCQSR